MVAYMIRFFSFSRGQCCFYGWFAWCYQA